ncbi:MAG: tRNA (N(6)-L-threonylcarbamoyladenosine(37)-C(2))-methylthiotransferase MtaB [Lachnospiraceae bacterium]|nr:tRNA (N(6)-L-threonylcarbamoyladenosine(37)-C(2))-methylthiotransferase MtaB [Lachnospiraceae bacterium]
MRTVALHSLGCKVNAYETEGIQQKLQEKGYLIVPFDSRADIYIVNTCSVTNIADHKSRQMLHRAKKLNPEALVVAIGCYVETGREVLENDPDVDLVIGNDRKMKLPEIIEDVSTEQSPRHIVSTEPSPRHIPLTRTRSFIKIQDGCNRFCTYCVIPYARGRVRSREIPDIVSEVRDHVAAGCKEIVLTGIHISSFGTDRDGEEMIPLLKELNTIDGLRRIRLGSLEPAYVTPEWVGQAKEIDKLCAHFHLSMQSGSETVLKRMNRHYTPEEYYEKVCMLRDAFDDPAITTDTIVGFPGETEEEYEETYDFVRKVGFYELHVFKYSRRDGTPAARMPDQIPEREKHARSEKLISLGKELSLAYRRRRIGTTAEVLTEEVRDINGRKYMCGFTPEYICAAVSPENPSNTLITGVLDELLTDETVTLK